MRAKCPARLSSIVASDCPETPGTIDPPLEHAAIPKAMTAATTDHNDLTLARHTQTSKEGDSEKATTSLS
jgi:hypothetical protein